jgi:hypothetical protein
MESKCDSLSSGERSGMSLNRCDVIARWRCHIGVVGLTSRFTGAGRELQILEIVEAVWKAAPQRVKAP